MPPVFTGIGIIEKKLFGLGTKVKGLMQGKASDCPEMESNMEQKNKSLGMRTVTMAVNMLLLILGLMYVVMVTASGYNDTLWYKLSLMILMMGYSVLFNIAALYGMNAFENMTRQQGRSYFAYMIFDAVELCFLAMFVVNAGDYDEPFHYISLGIFVILTIPRYILYHAAVDSVKEVSAREKAKADHIVTAKDEYADKKREKEKFPEPKLREDRFVSMKLGEQEGYVGTRSVDDKGNLDIKNPRR